MIVARGFVKGSVPMKSNPVLRAVLILSILAALATCAQGCAGGTPSGSAITAAVLRGLQCVGTAVMGEAPPRTFGAAPGAVQAPETVYIIRVRDAGTD